jgi:lipopolysaccharide export system protein LptC
MAMAVTGTRQMRHSKVVGVLKIVLPLTALVLLSLVFLLAETIDPTQAIRTATVDVEDLARDPRLSGSRFAGVTEDGAALTIHTETVRSDPTGAMRLEVTGLTLDIEGQGREAFHVRAAEGIVDRGNGSFSMRGGLQIEATPGYRLSGEHLTGLLDNTLVEVRGAVSGEAPAGQISAGNLVMRANSGDNAGYLLVFGGGVRLIYQPPD